MADIDMQDDGLVLHGKALRFFEALTSGASVRQGARISGLSERTCYRWLQNSDFRAMLREAQQETLTGAIRRLSCSCDIAISTLRALATDAQIAPAVRARAATDIISHATKLAALGEIEERLAILEETFGKTRQEPKRNAR